MRWVVVLLAALAMTVGHPLSKALGGHSARLTRVLLATIDHTAFALEHPAPPALALNSVSVTADNFNRAETEMYFGRLVKQNRIGNLSYRRQLYLNDSPVVPTATHFIRSRCSISRLGQ